MAKKRNTSKDNKNTEQDEKPVVINLVAEHMLGDMMSFVIQEFKAMPEVWQKMSEAKQREVIHRAKTHITHLIDYAVHVIAADEKPVLQAKVDKVEFKDGVKATLTMSQHNPARHDLADAQGATVLIVIADAKQYQGGGDDVKADKDQPDMFEDTEQAGAYDKAVQQLEESGELE